MNIGVKTSEFLLVAIVIIGIFTLIGLGKLEADITSLGSLITLALGYGIQRTLLKSGIVSGVVNGSVSTDTGIGGAK